MTCRARALASVSYGRLPGLGVLLSVPLLGCGSDLAAPKPAPDPSRLYWALTLDHHAVNLSTAAPYDTLQLRATGRSVTGDPLPLSGTVVYTSTSREQLQVSPDGLLHALGPADGLQVVATLTIGNLTHADTVQVNVTANPNPPVLARLSIHPIPPDSAKRAGGIAFYPWPVYATDTSGQAITGLAISCTSAGPTPLLFVCGFIEAALPGHAQLIASTTAYGVTKADTLDFTVGQPIAGTMALQPGVALGTVTIAVGGTVQWVNKTGQVAAVTFDDPTNVAEDPGCQCGAGNIAPFGNSDPNDFAGNTRSRLFPVAGTYTYHSSTIPGTGTVLVVNDR